MSLEEAKERSRRSYELQQKLLDGGTLTDEEICEMCYESGCVRGAMESNPEAFAKFKADMIPEMQHAQLWEFNGQNCEECDGWDGIGRRCECGNRRVEWILDHGHWYGEAW